MYLFALLIAANSSRPIESANVHMLRSQTANLKEELAVCSLPHCYRVFVPPRILTHHADSCSVEI